MYRVIITKIEKDVPYTEDKWQRVVDVPDSKHEDIYQYIKHESTHDVSTEVLNQVVDDLDVIGVIKAINNIGGK